VSKKKDAKKRKRREQRDQAANKLSATIVAGKKH
jgi:hypothetical protein